MLFIYSRDLFNLTLIPVAEVQLGLPDFSHIIVAKRDCIMRLFGPDFFHKSAPHGPLLNA
jgi:hypothetical protein